MTNEPTPHTHTPDKKPPPDPHHKALTDPATPPTDATPVTPKTVADAAAELITDSDTIQAAMEASLRVIAQMSPADQTKMFQAMDDDDARQGLRERRSALIRGRLGLLAEKDAAAAEEKAKQPPATTTPGTPADDKTPPAFADDKPPGHADKKKGFF